MVDYTKLNVWQRSDTLVKAAYRASASFPRQEAYGITAQLRRSAVSVPSNIAEGCGRKSDRELVRFLYIARGSANETHYLAGLARRLEMGDRRQLDELQNGFIEVRRMITALIRSLSSAASED